MREFDCEQNRTIVRLVGNSIILVTNANHSVTNTEPYPVFPSCSFTIVLIYATRIVLWGLAGCVSLEK